MNYKSEHLDYCCQSKELIKNRLLNWQKNRGVSPEITEKAIKDIYIYGREIVESDEFKASFSQTHHHVLTVGEHTLHVAIYALELSYDLIHRGYDVNIRDVVLATLCHDLGILGRYEKFANDVVCCYLHPIHSAIIAKRLVPDISPNAIKAIARHMFPATIIPPFSLTGYILIRADKACAFAEVWSQRKFLAQSSESCPSMI